MAKFNLWADVLSPVGAFSGRINKVPVSEADAIAGRDQVQRQLHQTSYLVIYDGNDDEITMADSVIRNSVFRFSVLADA